MLPGRQMGSSDVSRLYDSPLQSTRTGVLYNAFSYPTKIDAESVAVFLAAHTQPCDTVLDVFAGSGSTGIAARLCDAPTPRMRELASAAGVDPHWGPRTAVLYELSPRRRTARACHVRSTRSSRIRRGRRQLRRARSTCGSYRARVLRATGPCCWGNHVSLAARDAAPDSRKRLGQVFTGEPLARLLAALARAGQAPTIIDPMVGSGDMLAACRQFAPDAPASAVLVLDDFALPEDAERSHDGGRSCETGVRCRRPLLSARRPARAAG